MFIGDILVAHKLVTPADVAAAVERQKATGGRLGDILVAQGKLSSEDLETVMHGAPMAPRTLAETGLGLPTLLNLLIKAMYAGAAETPSLIASFLRLPHRTTQLLIDQAQERKLLDVLGDDVTQDQAFAHANDVLKNAVGGISDIIHIPGLVNVDFEDVKTVMSEPGKAMMGTAQATGPDRAAKAAEAAVACPLLEGIDLSGARGVLVLIAAGRSNFKLSESRNAMNAIKRYASDEAHVIFGTAYDETLGDALRVTVIATGLTAGRARQQAPLQVVQTQQVVRNGTDGMPVLTQAVAMAAPTAQQANVGLGLGDFANANVPSVWRHGRSGSAAAKVEALSSNGMDEIEIPAFLRKQAD